MNTRYILFAYAMITASSWFWFRPLSVAMFALIFVGFGFQQYYYLKEANWNIKKGLGYDRGAK